MITQRTTLTTAIINTKNHKTNTQGIKLSIAFTYTNKHKHISRNNIRKTNTNRHQQLHIIHKPNNRNKTYDSQNKHKQRHWIRKTDTSKDTWLVNQSQTKTGFATQTQSQNSHKHKQRHRIRITKTKKSHTKTEFT